MRFLQRASVKYWRRWSDSTGVVGGISHRPYIYIYIYKERERERGRESQVKPSVNPGGIRGWSRRGLVSKAFELDPGE